MSMKWVVWWRLPETLTFCLRTLINILDWEQVCVLKGCGLGTLFVLVSPCFRGNVVVIYKIRSFLCSLNYLLQKNVIVFFFRKSNFKMALFGKKELFLTFFSHFLVTTEKLQKFLQHISHSHTCILLTLLTFFLFALLILNKIWIYQVWLLFGMSPGGDSYLCHFRTINK